MRKTLHSPGFIIGLVLLLANDFFLKSYFHNALTGKLSDFAGLFIFPVFWSVLLPKHTIKIYFSTALFFIFWKSPWSDDLIQLCNFILPFQISRVIDYSDLTAIAILPLSYLYFSSERKYFAKLHPVFIICLTGFSFIATSKSNLKMVQINKTYSFSISKTDLKTRMSNHPNLEVNIKKSMDDAIKKPDEYKSYNIDSTITDTSLIRQQLLNKFIPDSLQSLHFKIADTLYLELGTTISGDLTSSNILISFCRYNYDGLKTKEIDRNTLIKIIEKHIILPLKNNSGDE